jgi:hypothetical protein
VGVVVAVAGMNDYASRSAGREPERRYRFRAQRFGRLIVTTCIQGTCYRIVDEATTLDREGNRYASKAIILRPWRRNEWGEYLSQRALVIGWRR